MWHGYETTVCRVEVERWNPVIGLILLDKASRAGSGAGLCEIHGEAKARATHNGMDMTRDGPWVNDRIGTLNHEGVRTGHPKESRNGSYKSSENASGRVHNATETHRD